MTIKPKHWQLAGLVPLTALAIACGAQAQDSAGERATTLEEVVVTARRVEEGIQSTPVSMRALDAKALREKSISTPDDIQLTTPGVFLAGSGGRQNVIYSIRGQSKALSGTSSPAVVSYFAEVPDPSWGSFVPQYDMASVQVLKGPQGTLFGRNTTGGALLYQPRSPDHEFGGYVTGTLGNYDKRQLQGAVNVPLVEDKVALRIAADIDRRDGYTENVNPGGHDLDNVDTESFRVSLLVEPTENLRNTTIYEYYISDNNGPGDILTDVLPGNTLMAQLGIQSSAQQHLVTQKLRGPRKAEPSIQPYERNKHNTLVNRTEFDFGNGMQLVNIFGYRHVDLSYATNVDGMPTLIADGTGAFPAGVPVNFINADLHQVIEQYSNEIQLRGQAMDDKLDWLFGLFWLQSEPDGPQGNTVAFAQIPGTPLAGPGYNFIEEESRAVFANFSYDLGDHVEGLELDIGLRLTEDEIESCTGTGTNTAPGPAFASSGEVTQSDCLNNRANILNASQTKNDFSELTWSVGLNWQVNDDLFSYIVTRRGYRAGGVNGPSFVGRLAPYQQFDAETVTDVEAGVRADWLVADMDVRTNISVFYGLYDEVQMPITGVQLGAGCDPALSPNNPPGVSPDGFCDPSNHPAGGTLLVNLGESEVSGVDAELTVMPTENLTLNLAGTYLNPRTKTFEEPAGLAPYLDADEIPFNFVAERTLVAGIRYAVPVSGQWADEAVFNADYYWTDELLKGDIKLPSYEVTNLRLDVNNVNRAGIDVSFFVRNLFDKEYIATNMASGSFLGMESSLFGPPRTYGTEVRYNF